MIEKRSQFLRMTYLVINWIRLSRIIFQVTSLKYFFKFLTNFSLKFEISESIHPGEGKSMFFI